MPRRTSRRASDVPRECGHKSERQPQSNEAKSRIAGAKRRMACKASRTNRRRLGRKQRCHRIKFDPANMLVNVMFLMFLAVVSSEGTTQAPTFFEARSASLSLCNEQLGP